MLPLLGCSMPPPTCMRCLDAKGHSSLLAGVLWIAGSRLGGQLYLAQAAACMHAQAGSRYQKIAENCAGRAVPKICNLHESTTKDLSSRQLLWQAQRGAGQHADSTLQCLLDSSSQLTTAPEL